MASLEEQLIGIARQRCQLEDEERDLVAEALRYGWTYADIGRALGVSKQVRTATRVDQLDRLTNPNRASQADRTHQ